MDRDCVQPFLFDRLDIRGALVSLDACWRDMVARRGYADAVQRLFGEMSAVTVLIAANLKQPGRMTFQLRGSGPVNLLVLDCDEQLRLRGMARADPAAVAGAATARALLGDGHLLLTLDAAGMRQPYQSVVPLDGDSIAALFEHYLTRSEQLPTRLRLAADATRATGLFLQKLPDADARDADGWQRLQHLLATLGDQEMLALPPQTLLQRLFADEDVRVFAPRPVTYHCPRDWDKIHDMLRGLGRAECDAILADKGEILIRDDICDHEYRLDPSAVAALFEPPSRALH